MVLVKGLLMVLVKMVKGLCSQVLLLLTLEQILIFKTMTE